MLANLRRLFLDGLLVMLPLALLGFLAYQVVVFFRAVIEPIEKLLPGVSVLGVGVLTIAAVFALILVTLFFGLLVRWRRGAWSPGSRRRS